MRQTVTLDRPLVPEAAAEAANLGHNYLAPENLLLADAYAFDASGTPSAPSAFFHGRRSLSSGRRDDTGPAGDLYISVRRTDGTWEAARNLGPLVNTDRTAGNGLGDTWRVPVSAVLEALGRTPQ